MENFRFHEMYEKWKYKDTEEYREEWIEDWRKYPPQDYKKLSIDDRLDFHNGVQNGFIPTVLEHGVDHHYIFFNTDRDHFDMLMELRDHPEQFELDHIPRLLELIDDECYELSWQQMLAKMVYKIILYYGAEGLTCYLQSLSGLSSNNYYHGCELIMGWLLDGEDGRRLISSVFSGYEDEKKAQIQKLLYNIIEDHDLKEMLRGI